MRRLVERGWFVLCLAVGILLRSVKYSTIRVIDQEGKRLVRKRRAGIAPIVVWVGNRLFRALDAGVRLLRERDWHERERLLHERLDRTPVRVDGDGTLVLPFLPGETLGALLEHAEPNASIRGRAIELATRALADLHRMGFTHGDAMADNVMVDLGAGVAHWFDFETVHDPTRPRAWCRADDVRALLTTCLVRSSASERAGMLALVLEEYQDDEVTSLVAGSVAPVLRRSLAFHLGQAALPYTTFTEASRLLRSRAQRAKPAA